MQKTKVNTAILALVFFASILISGCAKEAQGDKTAKGRIASAERNIAQNKLADSVKELKAALAMEPGNYEAHYWLGVAYYKAKDFAAAEGALEEALSAKPKDARAYNMLGLVCERTGRFDSAKKYFQEAISADKRLDEARSNLANIESAKVEYLFYKFAMGFIYELSKEYSNGNNAFMRGIEGTSPVRSAAGEISRYSVSSDIYLAKEYFDKCSRLLEDAADTVKGKALVSVIDAFSAAIQQRQEAIDLQVQGYLMSGNYTGEFERAEAKVKIADTYYVDAARKIEEIAMSYPEFFTEKDLANLKYLINYYSKGKSGNAEIAET